MIKEKMTMYQNLKKKNNEKGSSIEDPFSIPITIIM